MHKRGIVLICSLLVLSILLIPRIDAQLTPGASNPSQKEIANCNSGDSSCSLGDVAKNGGLAKITNEEVLRENIASIDKQYLKQLTANQLTPDILNQIDDWNNLDPAARRQAMDSIMNAKLALDTEGQSVKGKIDDAIHLLVNLSVSNFIKSFSVAAVLMLLAATTKTTVSARRQLSYFFLLPA